MNIGIELIGVRCKLKLEREAEGEERRERERACCGGPLHKSIIETIAAAEITADSKNTTLGKTHIYLVEPSRGATGRRRKVFEK